jgi:hypothetical protein
MSKIPTKIQENVFSEIAKLLIRVALKDQFSKRDIESDPSLKATMDSIKFHVDTYEKQLSTFCTRFPDFKHCKDLKKDK